MMAKKTKSSLKNALQGKASSEGHTTLRADVKKLLDTLDGKERAEAVIERVQRFAVETVGLSAGSNFQRVGKENVSAVRDVIRRELIPYAPAFVCDAHRETVVRCHARGMSTADAASQLIRDGGALNRLAQEDALGFEYARKFLIHRLSYLKPGAARWPEAKYGAVWREAREKHRQQISDIPFSSQVEQAALLAKNAERINRALDNEEHSAKDFQMLTNSADENLGKFSQAIGR